MLVALAKVNDGTGVNHMRQRILIANPGDAFEHGSRTGPGPDVAKMIIDRAGRDRISAVVGITQSRRAALDAVTEISQARIPVIASSVTGSVMVAEQTAADRYFQVSPTNGQIAEAMTAFARPAKRAIVVYHPDDEIFSADPRRQADGPLRRRPHGPRRVLRVRHDLQLRRRGPEDLREDRSRGVRGPRRTPEGAARRHGRPQRLQGGGRAPGSAS